MDLSRAIDIICMVCILYSGLHITAYVWEYRRRQERRTRKHGKL